MESPPARRRFTLADAMVLVAATAAGLPLSQAFYAALIENRPGRLGPIRSASDLLRYAPTGAVAASPCLALWSLALTLLVLRRPRPRWRRLMTRPGPVACLAAAAAYAACTAMLALLWALPGHGVGPPDWALLPALILPLQIGIAVAATWSLLALTRRWRPEPVWIDRWGRLLGLCWIALVPLGIWVILVS
jgi:hypothetical protein